MIYDKIDLDIAIEAARQYLLFAGIDAARTTPQKFREAVEKFARNEYNLLKSNVTLGPKGI